MKLFQVYQSLKSQFSVLYHQADILKQQAEEARKSNESMKTVSIIRHALLSANKKNRA